MNLFDRLVTEGLKNQPNLSSLRIVVEKELLHHDILRILRNNNLLQKLTFIGGTCLRCCYGGIRLSEDLDFTGGSDFSRDSLSAMGSVLTEDFQSKYGLSVQVSEPIKDKQNVDTWKIKIETCPAKKNLPVQRINIDICAIPSYEKHPMMLLNPYGVEMGTSGLILQVQSREEIYTDKLLAFAFRPNRIKYRDLWDIIWLHQQGFKPRIELIPLKLQDRNYTIEYFFSLFDKRQKLLKENDKMSSEFKQEMSRFLPASQISKTLEQDNLWGFIVYLIEDLGNQIRGNKILGKY
jgi:predicted nucleotidyltransferase component of viral defense system